MGISTQRSNLASSSVASQDYVGVGLPKELIVEVDRLVNRGALGFRSRAEFIADAIRRRLEEIVSIEKTAGKLK